MKYCKKCILPDSRPNVVLDENGICNASTNKSKESIDWKNREKEFVKIVKKVKQKKEVYDCVIPVSGGKDSTWQVIKMLEYDLKILCVNSRTCDFSEIGKKIDLYQTVLSHAFLWRSLIFLKFSVSIFCLLNICISLIPDNLS